MPLELTEHQKLYINPNAELWIEALQSGKYNQCEGALQSEAGYCCLGVGAHICEQNSTIRALRNDSGLLSGGALEFCNEPIKEWLGLLDGFGNTEPLPVGFQAAKMRCLTSMNDSGDFNFSKIAEVLLDNPQYYFVPVSKQENV
jgi:hypothetical protein